MVNLTPLYFTLAGDRRIFTYIVNHETHNTSSSYRKQCVGSYIVIISLKLRGVAMIHVIWCTIVFL